jgi:peptidyl-dipeptidase A
MVMTHFERCLYQDPRQDLNALWWQLVAQYQGLKPPERKNPDWAAKIHLSSSSVYYHNYLLGKLLASQLHSTFLSEVLGAKPHEEPSLVAETRLKPFLIERVFKHGARYHWNELVKLATGRPLRVDAFVRLFAET